MWESLRQWFQVSEQSDARKWTANLQKENFVHNDGLIIMLTFCTVYWIEMLGLIIVIILAIQIKAVNSFDTVLHDGY